MKSDRRIEIVKNAYIKIREDMEQYIKCLNVIGNNYKYSLRNQLRIFETNPNATACAEFNFWRKHFNRSVKMKQQGIPIYKRENKQKFISQIMTSKTPVRVAEDVDESSLSYAEIKALATGNPLIKEKMDLDMEVNKLALLEANYKNNLYQLEDKIVNYYPKEIREKESKIENMKADLLSIEAKADTEDKFTSIQLGKETITDKKLAGTNLLMAIHSNQSPDTFRQIGSYRGFALYSSYNSFFTEYRGFLKGKEEYHISFGKDPSGNIQRLDNLIDKIPERLKEEETKLQDLKENFEKSKIEAKKEFPHRELLREKNKRLQELNQLLSLESEKEKNIPEVSSKEEKEVREPRNPWAKKLKTNDLSR